MPALGSTPNTHKELSLVKEQMFTPDGGDRPDVPNTLVLLSEGTPTRKVSELGPYAQELRETHEVHIIGVEVSENSNASNIRELVSLPWQENFSHIEDIDAMRGLLTNKLSNDICTLLAPQGTTGKSRVKTI